MLLMKQLEYQKTLGRNLQKQETKQNLFKHRGNLLQNLQKELFLTNK